MSPITGGSKVTTLDDLDDVVINSAIAGDVLNYDGTVWINTANPHIGAGYATKPTGGSSGDISTYGRVIVGTTVADADSFGLDEKISSKLDFDVTVAGTRRINSMFVNFIGSGAAGAGVLCTGLYILMQGGTAITSGSIQSMGILVENVGTYPSGTTGNSVQGFVFRSTPSGGGGFAQIIGVNSEADGSTTAGNAIVDVIGILAQASSGSGGTVTNLIGVRVRNGVLGSSSATTNAIAVEVQGGFGNNAAIVTWSGLKISTGITAAIANKWSLDLTNTSTNMGSRIAHPVALGWNPATVATITARAMLAAGGTAVNTAPLRYQTGGPLTAPAMGCSEFTGERFYLTPTSLERQVVPGVLFTSTADATVTNTLVETTLVGAGIGDTTLNANFFVAAKTIRIRASGWIDTAAVPGTLQIRVRLGGIAGTVILDTGANAIGAGLAARYWNVDAIITCRTVGVGGTVIGQSAFQHMLLAQGNPVWWEMINIAAIALDTTIAEQVVLSAQWGVADAANIITCTNFCIEVLN